MNRVLISVFGSAGDLFPLLPIAARLRTLGAEVLFVAPRSLGLYLRGLGERAVSLGSGVELSAMEDPHLFTTRFGGWSSQRRIFVRYVQPHIGADARTVRDVIREWAPNTVVTTTFAPAARIAAASLGVRHVPVSIYPDYFRFLGRDTAWARSYQRAVAEASPAAVLRDHQPAMLAWGVGPETLLLHEPLLVDSAQLAGSAVPLGYPYWDSLPSDPEDLLALDDWLGGDDRAVVAVTLGSFIGVAQNSLWDSAITAARRCDARLLIVNARRRSLERHVNQSADVAAVGYIPLSHVLRFATAVIHHGGLGTTVAALRERVPAVIVPQAFDQPSLAARVERLGAGRTATVDTLADVLESVFADARIRARVADASSQLLGDTLLDRRILGRIVGSTA